MKFSEFDRTSWPALAPYLDTCLLPVTGLRGTETPDEMTDKAAAAGAWLSPVEQAFKGRTVTLPAHHYYDGGDLAQERLRALCEGFRRSGFRYVVLVSGSADSLGREATGADLVLQPGGKDELPDPQALCGRIVELWRDSAPGAEEPSSGSRSDSGE